MSGVTLLDHIVNAGEALWRASWQASVLAAIIGVIHWVSGRHISPRWRHAMWMLVLVRLALPVVPSSSFSLFNFAPTHFTPAAEPEAPHRGAKPRGEVLDLYPGGGTNDELILVASKPVVRPVPAAVVEPKKGSFTWQQVAALAWLAIAMLMTARIAWATLRVDRMIRRLRRVGDAVANDILADAAAEVGVKRTPILLAGDGLFSPALVGFVRPKLLLPSDLLVRFEPAELRLIFLHELAHLKRRDISINWAATILSVLHWPNPIVWLAVRRLRLERELACDELVVARASETERRAYGHTIVKLLETFSRGVSPMPGSVGILEGKQQMKRRITMIARFAKRNRAWSAVAAVLVLGLSACALTDGTKTKAGSPDVRPQTQPSAVPPTTSPSDLSLRMEQLSLAKEEKGKSGKANELPERSVTKPIAEHTKAAPDVGNDPKDYVIGPNDLVIITIFDLEGAGKQTIKQGRVSGTGTIILPYIENPIRIAGLSEDGARKEIAKAYSKGILEHPVIDVSVAEARNLPPKPATIDIGELVMVTVADLMGNGIDSTKTSRVDAEGNITFPYAGQIKTAGLKPEQVQEAIAKSLEKAGVMMKPVVVVSLPDRGESHTLRAARNDKAGHPAMADAGPAAAEQAMSNHLNRSFTELKFDKIPFSEVIEKLREITSVNISVNWRSVESAGIDQNAPVTLKLKNVALKDVLNTMLSELSPGLAYKVEGNVIRIVMAEDATPPTKAELKAYDVTDLLPVALPEGQSFDEKLSRVADVIMRSVQPGSWRQGDEPGRNSMSFIGSKIVVSAPAEVHREVENLLKMLREKPAGARAKPAPRASGDAKAKRVEDMSVEDIALEDPQMFNHLRIRDQIAFELEATKQRLGPNHPQAKTLFEALKIRERMVQERADWFRETWKDHAYVPGQGTSDTAELPLAFKMPSVIAPVKQGEEFLQKLWEQKYAPRIYTVGGNNNLKEITAEFRADVQKMTEAAATWPATAPSTAPAPAAK
jgi:beta-lactamase regulating signal transducer with metallopeptidase domain/protein involved in polysaccharide export with SLBB domain